MLRYRCELKGGCEDRGGVLVRVIDPARQYDRVVGELIERGTRNKSQLECVPRSEITNLEDEYFRNGETGGPKGTT